MNNRLKSLVLVIGVVAIWGSAEALAEPSIGAYFDPEGTAQQIRLDDLPANPSDPDGFRIVNFYAVVHGVESDLLGFRMGLSWPDGVFVLGSDIVGVETDACGFVFSLDDLHCYWGTCASSLPRPQVLATVTLMVPEGASNLVVSVDSPANEGTFTGPLSVFAC